VDSAERLWLADLWQLREAAAKPAAAFTLPDYPDRKNVSLADYRGKVVLLNFWYPSCGPCRGEFPTLQRVLDKYKDRGFEILSLNVLPDEQAFVMPYLTKNRFTFHALETTTEWAEKTYAARGFPTNLLIDADGRIMFKPGIIRSPREQRTFELQIEALLAHAKKGE
jgi:thiol-disulfide isomerase/thioredoxin